jgi:hypothetical protein
MSTEAPTVGTHATLQYITDRYPYEVIEVPNAKTVIVREMKATRADSHGMSDCQAYEYSSDPNGDQLTFTLRNTGRWIERGIGAKQAGRQLVIGSARRYHDYSF